MVNVNVTVAPSFGPTEVICTDGEWTASNDTLRVAAAGRTEREARENYSKAVGTLIGEALTRTMRRMRPASAA